METYYRTEKVKGEEELESPNYYKNKLSEIVSNIKSEIDKGGGVQVAIDKFIYRLVYNPENIEYQKKYGGDVPLTKTLSSGKISCVSSSSLYLILSEAIDFDLFEKYNIGEFPTHVIIRKNEGEYYKNIDQGRVRSDKVYKDSYNKLPTDKPKEFILSSILYNCGCNLGKRKSYDKAIKYYNKALEINPDDECIWNNKGNILSEFGDYEKALKCYNKALEIDPDDEVAQNNNRLVLSRLEYDPK
ncbi:MAG: tetratricopeptide repeat protein [Candidatus Aenigmarchaeota archaeon]|nr:tetratricopeptide repeat protein [Candidatus Aenigmarchaeota archaeon]